MPQLESRPPASPSRVLTTKAKQKNEDLIL